jgi:hypothetical protein
MTKHYCDRCKRECTEENYRVTLWEGTVKLLCHFCMGALALWMETEPDDRPA